MRAYWEVHSILYDEISWEDYKGSGKWGAALYEAGELLSDTLDAREWDYTPMNRLQELLDADQLARAEARNAARRARRAERKAKLTA